MQNGTRDPRSQKTDLLLIHSHFYLSYFTFLNDFLNLVHFFNGGYRRCFRPRVKDTSCISCSALSALEECLTFFRKLSIFCIFLTFLENIWRFYSNYVDNAEKPKQIFTFLLALVKSRRVLSNFLKNRGFKTQIAKNLRNLQEFKVIYLFLHTLKLEIFF